MRRLTLGRRQRGSVLFLFPVGFLIVVILGAVAVDLANVWLQQRRLADAVDAAANDAVAYGVDLQILRGDSTLELSPELVNEAVSASIAGQALPDGTSAPAVSLGVNAAGDPTVEVRLDATVDLIFGRIVRPGGLDITAVGVAALQTE